MAVSRTVSEIRQRIGRKSPNLPTLLHLTPPLGAAYNTGVILLWRCTRGWVPYLCAKFCFRSRTLAGFWCTLVDAEEQEEEGKEVDDDDETTRAMLPSTTMLSSMARRLA